MSSDDNRKAECTAENSASLSVGDEGGKAGDPEPAWCRFPGLVVVTLASLGAFCEGRNIRTG